LFSFLLGYFLTSLATAAVENEANNSKDPLMMHAPRVYLDCQRCDVDYIKTNVNFVNYVREQTEADIHILLTTRQNGSGGTEYTFFISGSDRFATMSDTLVLFTNRIDTGDEIRQKIAHTLKLGLTRFVARTSLADHVRIYFDKQVKSDQVRDHWNYWVFNIDVDSDLSGEEAKNRKSFRASLSADRITPNWKKSFFLMTNYRENNYYIDDTLYSSITRSQQFKGLLVKSVSEHWSWGSFVSIFSSDYSNIKIAGNIAPAVEYNVFPYSESTRRELRFLYLVGYSNTYYNEETIYNKTQQHLFNEELSATFEIKEKWGSISTSLIGSHYFHDPSKNRLELRGRLSLRLFEGLSLRIRGRVSRIHDQLSLSKAGVTEEEILLHRKQLATQYDYYLSLGIGYTFGSIYSNIVNPRFGV
ncbi:MAG: hypothetical protein SCK70_13785, partial [bacterium]|nr:hypothetical protein [bacterium]